MNLFVTFFIVPKIAGLLYHKSCSTFQHSNCHQSLRIKSCLTFSHFFTLQWIWLSYFFMFFEIFLIEDTVILSDEHSYWYFLLTEEMYHCRCLSNIAQFLLLIIKIHIVFDWQFCWLWYYSKVQSLNYFTVTFRSDPGYKYVKKKIIS